MPKINLHPLQFTITQANAVSTIYTVPYGKKMDIYEITIANPTSVTVTVSMSGVTRPIQTVVVPATNTTFLANRDLGVGNVMPGDSLGVQANTTNVIVTIQYELSDGTV
jgi:hypothetical protein